LGRGRFNRRKFLGRSLENLERFFRKEVFFGESAGSGDFVFEESHSVVFENV